MRERGGIRVYESPLFRRARRKKSSLGAMGGGIVYNMFFGGKASKREGGKERRGLAI